MLGGNFGVLLIYKIRVVCDSDSDVWRNYIIPANLSNFHGGTRFLHNILHDSNFNFKFDTKV